MNIQDYINRANLSDTKLDRVKKSLTSETNKHHDPKFQQHLDDALQGKIAGSEIRTPTK